MPIQLARCLNGALGIVAALGLILTSAGRATATEAAESAVETPPRNLAVWCGDCTRSLRCVDTFATVSAAAGRAAELRGKNRYVVILQGESNWSNALSVILQPTAENSQTPRWQKCAVHTLGCRLGSQEVPSDRPRDAAAAEREAAKRREAGQDAVVVYTFAKK